MQEELLSKAQFLQKKAEEIEQNLYFVSQQISELNEFTRSLNALSENKERKILSSLGKGIYVRAKIEEERLFVSVGAGVLVKKTIPQTIEILDKQILKFNEARLGLTAELESYGEEFRQMTKEFRKLK